MVCVRPIRALSERTTARLTLSASSASMASLVFSTGTTSMRIGARCERSVSAAEPNTRWSIGSLAGTATLNSVGRSAK